MAITNQANTISEVFSSGAMAKSKTGTFTLVERANSATATSVGVVSAVKGKDASLNLRLPICALTGSRITLSRRVGSRWRLIGHGVIAG